MLLSELLANYPDVDRMEAHEATPGELGTYQQIAAATTAPNQARRLALLAAGCAREVPV